MFSKLSIESLKNLIPYFESKPKFALFANSAKFEVEGRLPNHPCDFYYHETGDTKYFYNFRHDKLPNECRPMLMIGIDGKVNENDVTYALEQIKQVEPDLGKIEMLIATNEARRFLIENYNNEDYNNPCYNFYIPSSVESEILDKIESSSLDPDFSIGSTKISDTDVVNSTWKFGGPEYFLQIREFIQRLPTVCISHGDRPVAFEMSGLHGQLNHQYTFPVYRNRGLGGIVENNIVLKCFREGIQVVKSVEVTNEAVVKRSSSDSLWKFVGEDNGETLIFDYTHYH